MKEIEGVQTVFISYAREDHNIADQLYEDLTRQGYAVWLDVESIRVGQAWEEMIEKTIQEASYVVAIVSKNSIFKEGYIQKEYAFAIDIHEQRKGNNDFLIPVKIDEAKVEESLLGKYHFVDLGGTKYLDGLNKILDILDAGNPAGRDLLPDMLDSIEATVTELSHTLQIKKRDDYDPEYRVVREPGEIAIDVYPIKKRKTKVERKKKESISSIFRQKYGRKGLALTSEELLEYYAGSDILRFKYISEGESKEVGVPYVQVSQFIQNRGYEELYHELKYVATKPYSLDEYAEEHPEAVNHCLRIYEELSDHIGDDFIDKYRNSSIVSIANYNEKNNFLELKLAGYHDQIKTNFVLDIPLQETTSTSLRGYEKEIGLKSDAGSLPSFQDSVLANTIGIATLVITNDDHIIFPKRLGHMMAFGGKLGCSASGALEWTKRLDRKTIDIGFSEFLIEDTLREADEELGIPSYYLEPTPLAFCRELNRGGKPQFFYVSFCSLSLEEVIQKAWKSKGHMEFDSLYVINLNQPDPISTIASILSYTGDEISIGDELKANLYYLALYYALGKSTYGGRG
ncbi:MAG: toll/interleukin-1 receptor domain-containing protein [Bacteroidota bacterium]